jgi:RNA polymerase sigma factor (sigma-70 family)
VTTRPEFVGPALRGDAFALNSLFDSCRPQVWSIALGICGNTPAAEDAVQDALVLAYTRLSQLKDPAAFLPWVCQIVRNCCYQALRKEKAIASREPMPASDSLIEDSIEQHYDRLATRDSLYTSLSLLPEHLRSTMLLRYLSDYSSYQQIAEIMAIPVGTVRSRLHEGKKQLRQFWDASSYRDGSEYQASAYYNQLYTSLLIDMYKDPACLKEMFGHIDSDLELIFTSGKTARGRNVFVLSTYDDMEYGSCISRVDSCISSGNMSVLNVSFTNSPEFPNHCPPGSFLVLHRKQEKVTRMRMFHAHRHPFPIGSQYA